MTAAAVEPLKRYLVFAGNFQQFNRWRQERGIPPREALYVNDYRVVVGRDPKVWVFVKVGTYFDKTYTERLNTLDALDYLRERGFTEVAP